MSKFIESVLCKDETIVYEPELTIIVPVVVCLSLTIISFGVLGVFLLPFLAYDWLAYKNTEVALTDKRIIIKKGILSNEVHEFQLSKLETSHVRQSLVDKLFGQGTLVVTATGGAVFEVGKIKNPYELRKKIFG